MNQYAAVHAVAALFYNNTPEQLAELFMPGRAPIYVAEWVARFEGGIGSAVAHMDTETFRRFVDLAIEKHGANALLYHPEQP